MVLKANSEKSSEKDDRRKDVKYRRFLSQFMATTVENLLLFDMGLCNSFPFIIIAALTGFPNQHNLHETLSLTAVQASWLGAIGYVAEPIGSILSALITDALGRRTAMMVVNIPHTIAWFMMYNSSTVWEIFVANILLGLGAGLTESPCCTYVGEICEPSFRAIMLAYTYFGYSIGLIVVSTLNTFIEWRMVAFVCMFVPILTALALCFVPETPLFLLSKNRTTDAEKALCWLRGWCEKPAIADEFQALQRYSERSKSCEVCIKKDLKCVHPLPTFREKIVELKRKQTIKPFTIVMGLFMISAFSGTFAIPTYIVQIFQAYKVPMEADKAAALLSYVNNFGNVSFLCLLRITGKRNLYLTMLSILFLSSSTISAYGFFTLPLGYSSFTGYSANFTPETPELGYIPFICIIVASFCAYCGINAMASQLMSELFPYKIRGMATGITASISYILTFIGAKTYYSLETTLSMPGIALFNCVVIFVGLISMYKILPDTENRTLEEIEMHFADKCKKITDRKIPKFERFACEKEKVPSQTSVIEMKEKSKKGEERGCDNRAFSENA